MSDRYDFTTEAPRRVWPAVVAVVVFIAMVTWSYIFVSGDPYTSDPGPTAPIPDQTTPPQLDQPASVAASEALLLNAAPAGVSWVLVGQAAVPVSTVDGPFATSAERVWGFTRTPAGALLAAVQISTRAGFSAGRRVWEPTIDEQLVASPDRDALLGLLRDADQAGHPPAQAGELAQVAGFRFLSYTDDAAVIGVVRRNPTGMYAVTVLTVQWREGDWRLLAPPNGLWPAVTTPVTDMAGVVVWGAS